MIQIKPTIRNSITDGTIMFSMTHYTKILQQQALIQENDLHPAYKKKKKKTGLNSVTPTESY